LLGRFDDNRGRFGLLACRSLDNPDLLRRRCRDMARSTPGYIIVLTDDDIIEMLKAKAALQDGVIEGMLYSKFRELLQ